MTELTIRWINAGTLITYIMILLVELGILIISEYETKESPKRVFKGIFFLHSHRNKMHALHFILQDGNKLAYMNERYNCWNRLADADIF